MLEGTKAQHYKPIRNKIVFDFCYAISGWNGYWKALLT